MIDQRSRSHWFAQRFVWLVLVFACLGLMPRHAAAQTAPALCSIAGSTSVSMPAITVKSGTTRSTKLGSPVSFPVLMTCSGATSTNPVTLQVQILAAQDGIGSSSGLALQTNYPGIALIVTATPIEAGSAALPNGQTGWSELTVTSPTPTAFTMTFQYIVTGTVATGTIKQGSLAQFLFYQPGSPATTTAGPILTTTPTSVSVPGCSVNTDSTNLSVTLPTVGTQSLQNANAVAGRTRFNINLTCQPGVNVSINMTPSSAGPASGTIVSTGAAKNVAIQLLDGSLTPVTFSTPVSLGPAPTGALSIPYYAQYYAIAGPVGIGSVTASATFTMTYQ